MARHTPPNIYPYGGNSHVGLVSPIGPWPPKTTIKGIYMTISPFAHNPFENPPKPNPDKVQGFCFPKPDLYCAASQPSTHFEELVYGESRVQTGRRVRLVSMASGRALQILRDFATGNVHLDAGGAVTATPDITCNSAWTVASLGNCRYQFHCNDHYLGVIYGVTTVINIATVPEKARTAFCIPERTWLVTMSGGCLFLQSTAVSHSGAYPIGYLGARDNGLIVQPTNCRRDRFAQFGLQLLPPLELTEETMDWGTE